MRDSEKRLTQHRILDVVRSVRWRWRARLALRGLVWVGAITGAVLVLSALGLERMRFSAEAVVWLRVLTWGTVAVSLLLFLVRPLLRKVTDAQVALYLEEHEPSLEHSVTSVLNEGSGMASPALSHRVTEIALEKARRVEYGRRVEQSGLYRFAGALSALVVLAAPQIFDGLYEYPAALVLLALTVGVARAPALRQWAQGSRAAVAISAVLVVVVVGRLAYGSSVQHSAVLDARRSLYGVHPVTAQAAAHLELGNLDIGTLITAIIDDHAIASAHTYRGNLGRGHGDYGIAR